MRFIYARFYAIITSARRYCNLLVCSFVGVCVVNMFWDHISRKQLEIEAWLQWTTIRKWHMANQLFTLPVMSRDPESSRS